MQGGGQGQQGVPGNPDQRPGVRFWHARSKDKRLGWMHRGAARGSLSKGMGPTHVCPFPRSRARPRTPAILLAVAEGDANAQSAAKRESESEIWRAPCVPRRGWGRLPCARTKGKPTAVCLMAIKKKAPNRRCASFVSGGLLREEGACGVGASGDFRLKIDRSPAEGDMPSFRKSLF